MEHISLLLSVSTPWLILLPALWFLVWRDSLFVWDGPFWQTSESHSPGGHSAYPHVEKGLWQLSSFFCLQSLGSDNLFIYKVTLKAVSLQLNHKDTHSDLFLPSHNNTHSSLSRDWGSGNNSGVKNQLYIHIIPSKWSIHTTFPHLAFFHIHP
jgi:hypothetical protein